MRRWLPLLLLVTGAILGAVFLRDQLSFEALARHREALIALSMDSREEVDRIVEAAMANGGAAHGEAMDHGFMYYRPFTDPDGHVWELTHFPAA